MKYTEYTKDNYKYMVQDFDSISDLTAYLDKAPYNEHFRFGGGSSQDVGRSWSGTHDYKTAAELLSKGWSPEAEKLTQKLNASVQPSMKNTKPSYSVVGHQASVPRYLQGIPTNMVFSKPEIKKQKVVNLYRDITFSSYWQSEKIEDEGVKALRIVKALEAQGYRVNLSMIFLSESDRTRIMASVKIKRAEERLSIIKTAFPLAHTAMLRRIMFNWIEKLPGLPRAFVGGYGRPRGEAIKALLKPNDFFIPSEIGNVDKFIEGITSKL